MKTWVLVADGSRARFFVREKNRSLTESEILISPEQRLQEQELVSDRAGRAFDSRGGARHAMEPPTTKRQQVAIDFARRLTEELEQLRRAGELERLVLVAPPRFLGHLRSQLSSETQQLVALSVDKDLTQSSADQVAEHLPQFF